MSTMTLGVEELLFIQQERLWFKMTFELCQRHLKDKKEREYLPQQLKWFNTRKVLWLVFHCYSQLDNDDEMTVAFDRNIVDLVSHFRELDLLFHKIPDVKCKEWPIHSDVEL